MSTKPKTLTVPTDLPHLASQRQQGLQLAEFLRSKDAVVHEKWFSEQLPTVRALFQKLEDERTAVTKPMLAAKAAVDAMFKPATAPLKECEEIIRSKLAEAARVRLAAETAAKRLAAEAAEAGDHRAASTARAQTPAHVATTGSSARVVRKWRVVDLAAVPREYLMIDEAAVTAACKSGVAVAGVEYYDDVAVRAK